MGWVWGFWRTRGLDNNESFLGVSRVHSLWILGNNKLESIGKTKIELGEIIKNNLMFGGQAVKNTHSCIPTAKRQQRTHRPRVTDFDHSRNQAVVLFRRVAEVNQHRGLGLQESVSVRSPGCGTAAAAATSGIAAGNWAAIWERTNRCTTAC